MGRTGGYSRLRGVGARSGLGAVALIISSDATYQNTMPFFFLLSNLGFYNCKASFKRPFIRAVDF